MAITQKFNLPALLGDEAKRYRELFEKGVNRTASGSVTFTSSTSGTAYNSVTGENGIFAQLQAALSDYNIDAPWVTSVGTELNNVSDNVNKLSDSWRWTLIQTYDTSGTYTWNAPDIDDGNDYEIGVFIMGGGGSGGAVKATNQYKGSATGGAAGRCKNIFFTISPNMNFPVVVGQGGAAVSTSTAFQNSINGLSGGTSSFNGIVAIGGEVAGLL